MTHYMHVRTRRDRGRACIRADPFMAANARQTIARRTIETYWEWRRYDVYYDDSDKPGDPVE